MSILHGDSKKHKPKFDSGKKDSNSEYFYGTNEDGVGVSPVVPKC